MPIYEYQCPKCKEVEERQVGWTDKDRDKPPKCPRCGVKMQKIISHTSRPVIR